MKLSAIVVFLGLGFFLHSSVSAFAQKIDPPWLESMQNGKVFTAPGIDNVPDLHGDIIDPQLVVFYGGNQFMVVPDLLDAFRKQYPQYQRILVETLPPGVLADQVEQGALIIGNLRIEIKPDVFMAGKSRIERMQKEKGLFDQVIPYAKNRLAIMVPAGNPKKITSLKDLGREDVRVSMPNPEWEGIGNRIKEAYVLAGGKELETKIMVDKVKQGTTFLTQIHHRQTPIRLMRGESDAGPVWDTEVIFQKRIGNPIEGVAIPREHNIESTSMAAGFKDAPHPQAAADFLKFIISEEGQSIYRKHGFMPVK